jgi:hypothetical protein
LFTFLIFTWRLISNCIVDVSAPSLPIALPIGLQWTILNRQPKGSCTWWPSALYLTLKAILVPPLPWMTPSYRKIYRPKCGQ